MKVGVVGAAGTLGALLAESLFLAGHSVTSFTHNGLNASRAVDVVVDDPDPCIVGLDALIYCAWATRDRSPAAQMKHVSAVDRWAERSAALGCTFLFTSTVLAADDAKSAYGKSKYLAERAVVRNGGIALRIGLVADDALPLVLTSIRSRCSKSPSAARLLDWPIFPISSRAFGDAVLAELTAGSGPRLVWVAPAETTSLADVAAWNAAPRAASSIARTVIRLVARIPVRRGRVGKVLDGLTGLTDGPRVRDQLADAPLGEPIETAGWQECLRSTKL